MPAAPCRGDTRLIAESEETVNLYGTPQHRDVKSSTTPLVVTAALPVKKTIDPSLKPGETVVDDGGAPPLATSVTRDVYTAGGTLLYHNVWYSSYRSSPKLVRIGPKRKQPKPSTTTTTTTTAPTTTQQQPPPH